MSGATVRIEHVHRTFRSGHRSETALRGVSFQIEAGETVAITGPSGSGKTTLLHLLGGLDEPDEGSIAINGRDFARLTDRERSEARGLEIGFVFQSYQLVPHLNLVENVLLPRAFHRGPKASRERAQELLERVGLGERLSSMPQELSGGEQQRVAVARSLIQGAGLLLCDEPTGSLDRANGDALLDLLDEVNRRDGATIVLVTHDPVVRDRMRRVIELEDGRLLSDRPNEDAT